MPTKTYTALANTTLTATAASITFSSIPSTYRDLVIVLNANGAGSIDRATITLNGSGTSSTYVFMSGSGTAETSGTGSDSRLSVIAMQTASFTQMNLNIMDYSATDKHKVVLTRSSITANNVSGIVTRRAITAAVTSVSLVSNVFGIGTTAALYGIVS
jgi:hypothetical protein